MTDQPASGGSPHGAPRRCYLCGDLESAHTKSEADWRTVPGCTGGYWRDSRVLGVDWAAPARKISRSRSGSPPRPARGEGWQSIATAPKDGTNVLAWDQRPFVATWQTAEYRWLEVGTGLTIFPTLWMPLPAAPLARCNCDSAHGYHMGGCPQAATAGGEAAAPVASQLRDVSPVNDSELGRHAGGEAARPRCKCGKDRHPDCPLHGDPDPDYGLNEPTAFEGGAARLARELWDEIHNAAFVMDGWAIQRIAETIDAAVTRARAELAQELQDERLRYAELVEEAAYTLAQARAEQRLELEKLVTKWRNRAEPNFADPESSDETLAYWSVVKRCADELAAALRAPAQEET